VPPPPEPVDKPKSAYIIFVGTLKHNQEFQDHLNTNNKLKRNFLEEASKRWKGLTEDEKVRFTRLS
jgi:hypothetical protein